MHRILAPDLALGKHHDAQLSNLHILRPTLQLVNLDIRTHHADLETMMVTGMNMSLVTAIGFSAPPSTGRRCRRNLAVNLGFKVTEDVSRLAALISLVRITGTCVLVNLDGILIHDMDIEPDVQCHIDLGDLLGHVRFWPGGVNLYVTSDGRERYR